MTTPAPTVWVYVWRRQPEGGAVWWRYVCLGTDHEAAVKQATKDIAPSDVLGIESFDGEPRTWKIDSDVAET